MAKVTVSRQAVDEDNNLSWELVEVEAADLLEGESPYVEMPQP